MGKPEELFNLRHSSLRNVIERSFGVLKRRFKVLRIADSPEYDILTQIHLVNALTALHNFIRVRLSAEYEDEQFEQEDDDSGEADSAEEEDPGPQFRRRQEDPEMVQRREEIAAAMWEQYTEYLRNR
jgi:hypothetical protein